MADDYTVISEVFIGDPVNFRKDIYLYWLDGLSVNEAATKLREDISLQSNFVDPIDELVYEDVLDSYRIFDFFKESLLVNSWSIVDFNIEEKCFMCEEYFKLDDKLVREVISLGIGERKKSIIQSNRYPSKRVQEVLEGVKLMLDYLHSLNEQRSVIEALHKRFHIKVATAQSYACLLFLLIDNRDGKSNGNRSFLEWSQIQTIVWYMIQHMTKGYEDSMIESGIYNDEMHAYTTFPYSLELSLSFVEICKTVSNSVTKNWQMKTGDSMAVDVMARKVASAMITLAESVAFVKPRLYHRNVKLGLSVKLFQQN